MFNFFFQTVIIAGFRSPIQHCDKNDVTTLILFIDQGHVIHNCHNLKAAKQCFYFTNTYFN